VTNDPEMEGKLAVIARSIAVTVDAAVREYRAVCAGKYPGSKEEAMVVELIGGHLALRKLRKSF
jgi:hypothetical protein